MNTLLILLLTGTLVFMSNKTPPQSEHVNPIKEDLNELIRNNEFKKEKKLQKKLKVN